MSLSKLPRKAGHMERQAGANECGEITGKLLMITTGRGGGYCGLMSDYSFI